MKVRVISKKELEDIERYNKLCWVHQLKTSETRCEVCPHYKVDCFREKPEDDLWSWEDC